MPLTPPSSAEKAHQELLHLLVKVQQSSGKTGSLAEGLAKSLRVHMEREETLAMPLLGLLPDLVSKKPSRATATRASRLYSKMLKEYPGMLHGHREIIKILDRLKKIAAEEGHLTAIRFAETLEQHSKQEEEILYPAALLAGRVASGNKSNKKHD